MAVNVAAMISTLIACGVYDSPRETLLHEDLPLPEKKEEPDYGELIEENGSNHTYRRPDGSIVKVSG
jgi:hypothetical protein